MKAFNPLSGEDQRLFKALLSGANTINGFRKKIYAELDDLQADLDAWVDHYNQERTHQGKMCCGRTPLQTLRDGRTLWDEKVSKLN